MITMRWAVKGSVYKLSAGLYIKKMQDTINAFSKNNTHCNAKKGKYSAVRYGQ